MGRGKDGTLPQRERRRGEGGAGGWARERVPAVSPGAAGTRGSRSLAGKSRGPFVPLGGLSRPQPGALPVFGPVRPSIPGPLAGWPSGSVPGPRLALVTTGMGEIWWSLSWPGLFILLRFGSRQWQVSRLTPLQYKTSHTKHDVASTTSFPVTIYPVSPAFLLQDVCVRKLHRLITNLQSCVSPACPRN